MEILSYIFTAHAHKACFCFQSTRGSLSLNNRMIIIVSLYFSNLIFKGVIHDSWSRSTLNQITIENSIFLFKMYFYVEIEYTDLSIGSGG